MSEEDVNKSGRKPKTALESVPSEELKIDGTKPKEKMAAALKLKNTSKNKVAWKVSCNHPFVITLDKEIGFMEPGAMTTINVTRVPFDGEKYDNQGRRTNLLVQHVTVHHKANNPAKIWANVIGDVALKKRIHVKLMGTGQRVLGESVRDESGE